MKALNQVNLKAIHGGQTTQILDPIETFSVFLGSTFVSNIFLTAMGVSPHYSFPLSLFTAPIAVYAYAKNKENTAV